MTAAWSQRDFLGVSPTAVPSAGVASQREQLLIYRPPLVIRDVSSFQLGDEVMAQSWTLQPERPRTWPPPRTCEGESQLSD